MMANETGVTEADNASNAGGSDSEDDNEEVRKDVLQGMERDEVKVDAAKQDIAFGEWCMSSMFRMKKYPDTFYEMSMDIRFQERWQTIRKQHNRVCDAILLKEDTKLVTAALSKKRKVCSKAFNKRKKGIIQ